MKALQLDQEKNLAVVSLPNPLATEGQIIVKIHAASLNHRELWIGKGLYPGMTLPCILGADGAGIIDSIGTDAEGWNAGDEVIIYPAYDWGPDQDRPDKRFRVLGMPDPGTLAQYISVPATNIIKKPAYLSWQEAAAIPVASLTAWRALTKLGRITKESTVLITGIGGGVAQAGLAISRAIGAKVYVTSSSQEKIDDAIRKGASGGVNYKEEEWTKALKQLSGGIDMVLDSSPAANFDDYFHFLNHGARVVAYGSTGSRKTTVNISKFFLRHIQFIGTAMGSPMDFKALLDFMEGHQIIPVIQSEYSLERAIEAMDELATGKQIGKIVVTID